MVKFLGGLGDNRVKNVETPTFLPEDNIRFGVEYSPDSRPPVIGRNHTIRSNSIIYNDVVIGDNFRTGHNVVIRENTNIGDDVLIGTNTVIEGDVIIGNDVSIQSNVYIPTNSVIEDNVLIGACSLVNKDVAKNSTVVGVPAIVVSDKGSKGYI